MKRTPEPELMDLKEEVSAYASADFASVNQAFVDRLLELTGTNEQMSLVDFGTGPADIPIRIARVRPAWHITAVDASAPMLEVARDSVRKAGVTAQIKLVLADAKKSPLSAGAFDAVISNSILHHVSDTAPFWAEVKRVAKPGAWILIRDLARPESETCAREIVAQNAGSESSLLQEEFYRSLLAAYTPDEIRAQLQAAGLGELQVAMASDRHVDVFGRLS
jgi:ubiquinone/menaquinone biosynthesis C-methylase UbiE